MNIEEVWLPFWHSIPKAYLYFVTYVIRINGYTDLTLLTPHYILLINTSRLLKFPN